MTNQKMNHYGYRSVRAETSDPEWPIRAIEATGNVAETDPDVSLRMYGKRGGNRYDQTLLGMTLDEAEAFGFGILWLVAQLRGGKLDTTAQSVECEHGDGPHVGFRFAPDTLEARTITASDDEDEREVGTGAVEELA